MPTQDLAAGVDMSKMPGHWILARMGKKVLRPGGLELTNAMLDGLAISEEDQVVEFAPGLGQTTRLVLANRPASYVGVERDEAAATHVRTVLEPATGRVVVATAQQSGLGASSATVVLGEAFMTMQSEEHKLRIAEEAFRILKPGGRYAIHELCLRPDGLDQANQDRIRGELTRSIKVGARPCTTAEWRHIVEVAGFHITNERLLTMDLLSPRRVLADEGATGLAKMLFNIIRTPAARKRILGMRKTFTTNADNLGAVMLVAKKPASS